MAASQPEDLEGQFKGVGDVPGRHSDAQFPGDDVAGEVVEHGRQVNPAPADDLEVGEVGLPHLVPARGFGMEGIGCLDHHESRAGDQVVGLEQAVNTGLRHEVALLVGEACAFRKNGTVISLSRGQLFH